MHVAVLTRDLMFFSAVEGVAGAMGHRAEQVEDVSSAGEFGLLVADLSGVAPGDVPAIAALDPLRTAAFVPHVQVEMLAAARAAGIAHVYRRGALANELPGLLREYGEQGELA